MQHHCIHPMIPSKRPVATLEEIDDSNRDVTQTRAARSRVLILLFPKTLPDKTSP